MARYSKPIDADKFKHRYPCNLFFDLFPDFKDKFAMVYIDNLNIILKIYKDKCVGFKMLEMYYKMHLSVVKISEALSMSIHDVSKAISDAKNIIMNNKEVIFNGFGHSRLRNRTIHDLTNKGFSKYTAANLVDSGLYRIGDIDKLKNGKELIGVLAKKLDSDTTGKVLEDTLITMNRIGYDTSKFGYTGKKKYTEQPKKEERHIDTTKGNINRISDYKYEGFSETTFKVNCPECDKFFRIHIIGKISDEGKLHIENTSQNETGIFICQNCGALVSVDKVDNFIRNYL